jgi:hypothetical protein
VPVEEKLDGANVSLWFDEGRLRVATRGGADAMDRAGQLGRLRAWGAERHGSLVELLEGDVAAYGEWLRGPGTNRINDAVRPVLLRSRSRYALRSLDQAPATYTRNELVVIRGE